jgi:hypothetical protein
MRQDTEDVLSLRAAESLVWLLRIDVFSGRTITSLSNFLLSH